MLSFMFKNQTVEKTSTVLNQSNRILTQKEVKSIVQKACEWCVCVCVGVCVCRSVCVTESDDHMNNMTCRKERSPVVTSWQRNTACVKIGSKQGIHIEAK